MASDHRGKPLHAGKRTDDELQSKMDAYADMLDSQEPESDPEYDPADYEHGQSFPNDQLTLVV